MDLFTVADICLGFRIEANSTYVWGCAKNSKAIMNFFWR